MCRGTSARCILSSVRFWPNERRASLWYLRKEMLQKHYTSEFPTIKHCFTLFCSYMIFVKTDVLIWDSLIGFLVPTPCWFFIWVYSFPAAFWFLHCFSIILCFFFHFLNLNSTSSFSSVLCKTPVVMSPCYFKLIAGHLLEIGTLSFWNRFIRPEDVPVQYGGLSRLSDLQNGPPKPASEFTVKGGEKVNIQIEGIEVH